MMHARLAYMPLATYPEAVEDGAIGAAIGFASSIGCDLHLTTFSVDLPRVSSGLGDYLINLPGMIQAAEQRSKAECVRLEAFAREASAPHLKITCETRRVPLGDVFNAAASEARYCDLTLLPWSSETGAPRDLEEGIIFGSGRPAILVPRSTHSGALDHVAVAWDGSRVAARALGDVLPLLGGGGHVSVLTIEDEKPLGGSRLASLLAAWLERRGYRATPVEVSLGSRNIAEALQESAISTGSQLLAMGGFGHSRLRDFVLGGATKGILDQLQLPVLLSH